MNSSSRRIPDYQNSIQIIVRVRSFDGDENEDKESLKIAVAATLQ